MTCTLDSLCQLALMSCACACHSAGQDLASVRNILAELSCILVIDVLYLICAELADLSTTSVVSGTLGTLGALCSFSCLHVEFPPSNQNYELEREFAVVIAQLTELIYTAAKIKGQGRGGRCCIAIVVRLGLTFPLGLSEVYFLRYDLYGLTLVTLSVIVGSGLKTTGYGDQLALSEPLGNEFRCGAPGDDIDEVGLGLFTLTGERAIDCKGKRCDRCVVLGTSQLRIVP